MRSALRIPDELSARVPAEQRGPGLGRDAVRLLVSRGREVAHHTFAELPRLLRAGDLLVVNTSPTLAAAVDGRIGHARVVVHFSTRGDDGRWAVELREPDGRGTTRPWDPSGVRSAPRRDGRTGQAGGPAGAAVRLPGGARLVVEEPLSERGVRLWWAWVSGAEVTGLLREYGRPIRYSYTDRDQPLSAYQTVFALPTPDGTGSAEMPSAARPFTAGLVAELVSRGVLFAPVTLHTGVASAEAHEPPYPERFAVPETSARLVNAVRAGRTALPLPAGGPRSGDGVGQPDGGGRPNGAERQGGGGPQGGGGRADGRGGQPGGRVIAVGTTAVRALESATGPDGVVRAAEGWTDLVVTPERGVRVVEGLLTGLHEPAASHLLMLEAVAGRPAVDRGYEAALSRLYLWHEFGDVHLILPDENTHREHCSSNFW
ncbi:S-adenosylmethionine:tRNA ribosyltransferase-isomerase [Streptomyces sp. NPDC006012]|uniref:S-adenosylmethionine:tRNA ribosyltransferase-isomerase n=1 Tax=Streptomyces sp. NPDC006012 TaxID=3364739 RepID=UPI0036C44015